MCSFVWSVCPSALSVVWYPLFLPRFLSLGWRVAACELWAETRRSNGLAWQGQGRQHWQGLRMAVRLTRAAHCLSQMVIGVLSPWQQCMQPSAALCEFYDV